ncbi:hypothetical protein FB451DRAFT_1373822 [Mycena latifolia]|nr:hypothetical protein FB451DRAFT_1373822 [Mycena latifolia]
MDQSQAAATTTPSPHLELEALLATIAKLTQRSLNVSRALKEAHEKIPGLIDQVLHYREANDNVWVRAVAMTPEQATDGARPWWVVYIGREPGLYTTVDEATVQVKGCPNQEFRKKTSKGEALHFYESLYLGGKVEKWVEFDEDVDSEDDV